jgi:hypothetical protein
VHNACQQKHSKEAHCVPPVRCIGMCPPPSVVVHQWDCQKSSCLLRTWPRFPIVSIRSGLFAAVPWCEGRGREILHSHPVWPFCRGVYWPFCHCDYLTPHHARHHAPIKRGPYPYHHALRVLMPSRSGVSVHHGQQQRVAVADYSQSNLRILPVQPSCTPSPTFAHS